MDQERFEKIKKNIRESRQREAKELRRRKLVLYGLYAVLVMVVLFIM